MSVPGAIVLWGGGGGVYARQPVPSSESKELIDDTLGNIMSVTSARQYLGIVALEKGRSVSDPSGFFLVDRNSRQWTKIFARNGLLRAALSPDGKFGAFVICHGSCNLMVRQLTAVSQEEVIASSLSNTSAPSWNPDGQQMAVATSDGWIVIIDLATKAQRRLVEGENPAWSADGTRLAYVDGTEIRVYDFVHSKASKLYQRHFWQTRIVGPVSWGPKDVIAFNVPAGITGYEIECLLLDVKSRKVTSIQQGGLWCGPWLD